METITRQLLIMRHATADTARHSPCDHDRPLTIQGQAEARLIGQWLHSRQLVPTEIICSPAVRAMQTAQQVIEVLGFPEDRIQWAPEIYDAGLGDLIDCLSRAGTDTHRLLIIGHNPGIEKLLSYLRGGYTQPGMETLSVPPASLTCFAISKPWQLLQDGDAELVHHIHPGVI